ncbi:uncharacterized protein isoform X2 [Rhodnius prolixus]
MAQEDLYSEYICHNCVQMIELFYEFRNTCLKTHISMYNVIHGIPPSKYNLSDQENVEKDEGIRATAEVEIFSERSVEIESVDVDKRANKVVSTSSPKGELHEQIEINEDSSRQFQVGCYIPVIDGEDTQRANAKDTDLLHRRFKCMNCKHVYASLSELDSHWDVCENVKADNAMKILNQDFVPNQFSDEVCYEDLAVNETVEEKQVIENEENKSKKRSSGREFCCESCGQVFKQLLLLKRHIQVKHVCVRPYTCPHCPRKFFDKYELKYHQRLHEDIEDFCCNICKRRFSRRSGLKTHMRSHTGEKPFDCKMCSKSFAHLNSLMAHERVHTGERPYMCNYCPRTFAQYSTAKSHEEMHMGGLRMFQCEICDRMFKTELDLSTHRSSHEGLHEYKCITCNRGFKKQSDLNKHNQRYHCDNKPYPCNQCTKSYVTLRELQLHATVHTGELPFTCFLCSKSYRSSTTLKRHMYKHHSNSISSNSFALNDDKS